MQKNVQAAILLLFNFILVFLIDITQLVAHRVAFIFPTRLPRLINLCEAGRADDVQPLLNARESPGSTSNEIFLALQTTAAPKDTIIPSKVHISNATLFNAIVLSDDTHHVFASHMILKYTELWPGHPFVFWVPYNGDAAPTGAFTRYGDRVKLVRTGRNISTTILTLLEYCNCLSEMIYLAIDDKYPIRLRPEKVKFAIEWMHSKAEDSRVGGLSLGYMRWLDSHSVDLKSHVNFMGKVHLVKCKGICKSFWAHRFLRASLLQQFYQRSQDSSVASAKDYDSLIDSCTRGWTDSFEFWTIGECSTSFGESTSRGKITQNCLNELQAVGLRAGKQFLPATDADYLGCFKNLPYRRGRQESDDWKHHVYKPWMGKGH